MVTEYYSVFDHAVNAYLPPFAVRSKGEAIRSFGDACADKSHQFNRHAKDYVLFFIGGWDDQTGAFVLPRDGIPVPVVSAIDMLPKDDMLSQLRQ